MKKVFTFTVIFVFSFIIGKAQQKFEINLTDTITAKVDYIIYRFDGDFGIPIKSKDTILRNNGYIDDTYFERLNIERMDTLTKLLKLLNEKIIEVPGVTKYDANLSDIMISNRYNNSTQLYFYKLSNTNALNRVGEIVRNPQFRYIRKTIIQIKLQDEDQKSNLLRFNAVQKAILAAKDFAKKTNKNKVQLISVIEDKPYEILGYISSYSSTLIMMNADLKPLESPIAKNEFFLKNTYKVTFNIQ